tara:strand:+ start:586 stop:738 length:153 start_codon:yes stop_codon:yes gene_type:complete
MKKSFVYEYENTPKRRLLNGLETFVNYALTISFGVIVFGGVAIAIINLIQ